MSNIEKKALREAAEKATKGQWVVEFDDEIYSTDGVNNEQIAMVFSENEVRDAAFIAAAKPVTVLALLDELEVKEKYAKDRDAENEGLMLTVGRLRVEREAAEKRIAELEARTVKLPELKMLSDYLAEVTMREREDILVGVRLELFRVLEEAGVKVAAAAGKGEAS
ncbi:ead/Ea22-like family protein [Enterobacter sp. 22466]|uniref:ead/Ea22-like family protein n=1 Tax=Enterobacter sp. 22466 TaxID=3453924 RepID=UPI003F851EA4